MSICSTDLRPVSYVLLGLLSYSLAPKDWSPNASNWLNASVRGAAMPEHPNLPLKGTASLAVSVSKRFETRPAIFCFLCGYVTSFFVLFVRFVVKPAFHF